MINFLIQLGESTWLLGPFFSFIFFFHSAFSIFFRFRMWMVSCFWCMFQNATYFISFCGHWNIPIALKIDRYKDGCCLKYISGVGRSVCVCVWEREREPVSVYLILNCVCVVWTFIIHVLTFIVQHMNNVTPWSPTMTPYNLQVEVMLTSYIIQL